MAWLCNGVANSRSARLTRRNRNPCSIPEAQPVFQNRDWTGLAATRHEDALSLVKLIGLRAADDGFDAFAAKYEDFDLECGELGAPQCRGKAEGQNCLVAQTEEGRG